ncbi:MAG: site-specific DNA-methyltransferase [Gammaproteobacteria bacterium]|nr:site-specific DNA-methyltransferase [Gammaproteobacteria bacterium]
MPTLTWLTRDRDVKAAAAVPYRLLEAAPEHDGGGSDDRSENLLIQGDNLHALKALLPYYAGRVKCVFIDPPYNTRQDFAHYDDNLEHTQWLEMMYPRLELLRALLAEDGSIWVIIDDDEGHYLKVMMDEIFGRANFVANVVWQKKFSPQNDAKWLSDSHDHILCFAKNKEVWRPYLMPRSSVAEDRYENPDNDPRGPWTSTDFSVKTYTEKYDYPITAPSGRVVHPAASRCWMTSEEEYLRLRADNRIWFGRTGSAKPRKKTFLTEAKEGVTAMTTWSHTEVGHNQDAKKEVKAFNTDAVFTTPKPERLIQRVLQLATAEGDWVLDSFLGSGTTAAVAHKMGRRWIGIEMGAHAVTHCVPRLNAVIAGEQGGISKAANWSGGGGFGFYRLGSEAFTADGKINPAITFPTLASHVWFSETGTPWSGPWAARGAFLGAHDDTGYALLYNGALGDRRVNGGNVLTRCTLAAIRESAGKFAGKLVVYAAASRFGGDLLKRENIVFKQTPYEIEAR